MLESGQSLHDILPPEKVTHALATDHPSSPFGPLRGLAERRGWKTLKVHCCHDMPLEPPADVVKILLEAAG